MERPGEREGGREGEEEGGEGEKGRRGAAAVEQTRFSSSFCSALSEQKTRSPLYSLSLFSLLFFVPSSLAIVTDLKTESGKRPRRCATWKTD